MELKLTFNEDVLNYDKFRPTYVPELFEEIIEYTHLNDTKKVLEIGIGTGQATLPFLKEFSRKLYSSYNHSIFKLKFLSNPSIFFA